METKGRYIVLRSLTKAGDMPLSYVTDNREDAEKMSRGFRSIGFQSRVIDCDEEFARA